MYISLKLCKILSWVVGKTAFLGKLKFLFYFFYFGTPAGLFYNSVSEYVKNENTYCACTPYKYTDNAYLHLKKMR